MHMAEAVMIGQVPVHMCIGGVLLRSDFGWMRAGCGQRGWFVVRGGAFGVLSCGDIMPDVILEIIDILEIGG